MTTLEEMLKTLKEDEANILSQFNQVQGALTYNRQQQAYWRKQIDEKAGSNGDNPPTKTEP